MIVADVNLLAYLLIPGARSGRAERVYERDAHWLAPPLWPSEFLSILVNTLRAGLIKPGQADALWAKAPALILAEQEPDPLSVVRLAVKRGISAYDAQYVVLAQALGTGMVTAYKPLLRKVPPYAASIDSFAGGS